MSSTKVWFETLLIQGLNRVSLKKFYGRSKGMVLLSRNKRMLFLTE